MLHKVGLLPADNYQQVPFAYKMYTRTDTLGWEQSDAFKETFSADVDIEFMGVWDTVDSVGLIPRRLPFTTSNTIVRTFRHAVALDERRAKFKANLWHRPTTEEEHLGLHETDSRLTTDSPLPLHVKELDRLRPVHSRASSLRTPKESGQERKLAKFERIYSQKERRPTDIEEVWFAGCHSDIGGGSVPNKTRHSLARISLRWMVRECFKANTGIMFDSHALRKIGLDPSTLFPYVTPRPSAMSAHSEAYQKLRTPTFTQRVASVFKKKGKKVKPGPIAKANGHRNLDINEELEDLQDALSPVYDQLRIVRSWWVLEVIPSSIRFQNADNEWITYFSSNLARPRIIPSQDGIIKVHRTVQLRMEANPPVDSKKRRHYTPRARFSVEPTWID
ncbi:hypothetical protein DXG03_008692 [Asterophora parasitica]|uniref:T6SS Phospholipase effector Tle1-like catalytic domain-containing protein n=1 Tax=Asterophora parasitica TaxID=117018 RepID=A0A9P7G697_9AGAR|nr:hypothetical protein DXG03_008692 [Asterophora parasitica]